MPDYSKGKIYKILNTIDDEIYVGSTVNDLSVRMIKHRSNSKAGCTPLILRHMREIGAQHFYIELIENYPCNSVQELKAKEGEWIRKLGTLNKQVAGRTKAEWYEDNQEHCRKQWKEYRDEHKEEIAEMKRDWNQRNIEHVKERRREYVEQHQEQMRKYKRDYYERNKDLVKQRSKVHKCENAEKVRLREKQYRELNKERIRERTGETITCECGGIHTRQHKARHLRTLKHLNYIKDKNLNIEDDGSTEGGSSSSSLSQ